jgi:DNA-directed RNA polymerase subunit E'
LFRLKTGTRVKMYYKSQVESVVRIPPALFTEELGKAVMTQLKTEYEGAVFPELGRIIVVISIEEVGEGVLIPGDGAAYYKTKFTAINYIPELNELIEGDVKDIAKFGAFIDFGPFEGMVHISQTMDDFVSFSKSGALTGKQSGRSLKVGDIVRARVVAISFKDPTGPKIGLTMRQPYLGKLEWIEELTKGKPAKKEVKKKEKEKKEKK